MGVTLVRLGVTIYFPRILKLLTTNVDFVRNAIVLSSVKKNGRITSNLNSIAEREENLAKNLPLTLK